MPLLTDGFNTTITLAGYGGVGTVFVEREVTPPPIEGGGEINITAMRNVVWRTKYPKYLKTLGNMDAKVEYDPIAYAAGQIQGQINVNQLIEVSFPTLTPAFGPVAHTITFYGWLDKFAPESMKEGELPLADITIIPSMINAAGAETNLGTT